MIYKFRPSIAVYLVNFALALFTVISQVPAGAATSDTIAATTASAVSAPPAMPDSTVTAEQLSAIVAEAEEQKAANPDSQTAADALDLLKQAKDQLSLRDRFTSETNENLEETREAPAQLETVKAALQANDAETTPQLDIPTTATVGSVEQRVATAHAELKSLQDRLASILAAQQRRTTRADQIPKEIVEARQKQSEAQITLNSSPGSDDPLVIRARQLVAKARLAAANAQITALQAEQARYAAREELLPLARQLVSERISQNETKVAALENRLADLRKVEATATARQLKQASSETVTSHPAVRRIASENTSITAEINLGSVVEQQDKAQERLRQVREKVQQTSATFTTLQSKFETVGYSDALGIVIRRQRKELPNIRSHREHLEQVTQKIAEVNLQLLDVRDQVNELANPDAIAREVISQAQVDASTSAGRSIRNEVSRLLEARRNYLAKVAESYDKLFQTLVDLSAVERDLVQITTTFKAFIDERILWLPSTDRINLHSIEQAYVGFAALFQPQFIKEYCEAYYQKGKQRPFTFVIGAIILVLVIIGHREWKRRLHGLLQTASKNRLAHFRPLPKSLFYASLYVLPLPVILVLAGLPLQFELQVNASVAALADGLVRGGIALYVIRVCQVIIRRKGIAEVFYNWPDSALLRLRKMLSVLVWIYAPAIILIRMWQTTDGDAGMEASRFVLVFSLLAVLYFTVRMLWPKTSVLRGTELYQPGRVVHRFRYILFALVNGGIAALVVGALLGYLYTALQLSLRLNMSVWVGAALLLISETSFFWILVKRRRLALEAARKRRDALKAQSAAQAEGQTAEPPPVNTEPELDIASISSQAGRLLRVSVLGIFLLSLWGIWAEVLPALNYLDSYSLWSVSRTVTELDPTSGSLHTVDKLKYITLASVMLAFLVCVGVVVAIRNIPGLLDISLYQRMGVQAGEKYAFNTLIRYVLIIFMLAYVLYLLGLQWKQIQWLAAAVSVGLGFGLQEIFANFVSGLILLFERPIRVGDVVTVGSESGRVSQIRIRATTVVNWDHRILIIPNKELITKSVLNWTLADAMMRLVLTISIGHGSDYDKAREIVLTAIKENQYVLSDPAPAAAIEKTTIAGVDFLVLAHLPNGDHFMDARHEIITRVERDFRAAGIKLAAQKMDVEFTRAPGRQEA